MRKTLTSLIIMILILQPFHVESVGFEPGTPRAVSIGLPTGDTQGLRLSWINDPLLEEYINNNYQGSGLSYHVNIYIRKGTEILIKDLYYSYDQLQKGSDSRISVTVTLDELGSDETSIDFMSTSYSARVRYIQAMNDILGSYYLADSFSASASLGLIYPYNYASSWAIEELDKAMEYGFITPRISSNMRDIISREEFSEMMVSLYESTTGIEAEYIEAPFTDTNDPQISKAASLGIITGYDDGTFRPANPISRQDIALIIFRTLKLIIPEINSYYQPRDTGEQIQPYAYDAVMFLVHNGIMKGDAKGMLNPLDHTTREQAALLTLRAYEQFK